MKCVNQFLVSSVLVSLYAVTKVLSQIWGPPFCLASPRPGGTGGPSSGSARVQMFDRFSNIQPLIAECKIRWD